jgi:hypothetical protein
MLFSPDKRPFSTIAAVRAGRSIEGLKPSSPTRRPAFTELSM